MRITTKAPLNREPFLLPVRESQCLQWRYKSYKVLPGVEDIYNCLGQTVARTLSLVLLGISNHPKLKRSPYAETLPNAGRRMSADSCARACLCAATWRSTESRRGENPGDGLPALLQARRQSNAGRN